MSPVALPQRLPPAPAQGGTAVTAQPDDQGADFGHVLDGAAPPAVAGSANRRGAKATTLATPDGTGDADTERAGDDKPSSGGGTGQDPAPLAKLDITLLAQIAAVMPNLSHVAPAQADDAASGPRTGATVRAGAPTAATSAATASAAAGASLLSPFGKAELSGTAAPSPDPGSPGAAATPAASFATTGAPLPQSAKASPSSTNGAARTSTPIDGSATGVAGASLSGSIAEATPGAEPVASNPDQTAAEAASATPTATIGATPSRPEATAQPNRSIPTRSAAAVAAPTPASGAAAARARAAAKPDGDSRNPAVAATGDTKTEAGSSSVGSPVAAATASSADQTGIAVPTPAQQVTTALQSLASAAKADAPSGTRAAETASLPAAVSTAGGVKTVTIALAPEHLGPVSVIVRMKADAVEIQIAVSNPQALHLLERDRHALSAAVEALGGSGASLQLTPAATTADGGASAGFGAPSNGSGQQEASSDAASAGRGNQNRSAASRDASQSDADEPTAPPPAAAPSRARDGSLYL